MSVLDNINGKLTGTYELQKDNGTTITFNTNTKYVEQNIEFIVTAKTATPQFDGGGLSGAATATYTNATTSENNTSGISVVANATASREAVLYNGAVNGWVTKNDNDTTEISAISNQALTSETKYITGVTLTNGKTFDITVPNGQDATITFRFTVDNNGNTTVINAANA